MFKIILENKSIEMSDLFFEILSREEIELVLSKVSSLKKDALELNYDDFSKKYLVKVGICNNLHKMIPNLSADIYDVVGTLALTWEHSTCCRSFPVPTSTSDKLPPSAFDIFGQEKRWVEDQLDFRISLLEHMESKLCLMLTAY